MADLDDLASPHILVWTLGGVAAGVALAFVVLPEVAPLLAASLAGPQPRTWWYLARASGLVSYALLAASVLLGLLLSTRFAKEWPGSATAFTLHEHASVLGVAFALFHAVMLLGDRHTPFTVAEVLLPFGAAYRPFAVGLGQLALYGTTLLVASFYVRKRIGQRTWRLVHFGSFAAFVLALSHGLAVGTDRAAMLLGVVPAAGVLFFVIYRALWHVLGGAPAVESQSRRSSCARVHETPTPRVT
jgi:predicted ferric reductase